MTEWKAERDEQVPADVARLLATVPEWFGRPEANAEYLEAATRLETWTVRDQGGNVRGVTLVDRHFPHALELHLTVTDRHLHGQGIGTAMLEAIESDARDRGASIDSWVFFPWRKRASGARTPRVWSWSKRCNTGISRLMR